MVTAQRARVVILAAGHGKRMRSSLIKPLHPIAGKPMLLRVVEAAERAGLPRPVVVIGPQGDRVRELLGDRAEYAVQQEQRGTGHALLQAEAALGADVGQVITLAGDAPLVEPDLLRTLAGRHQASGAIATAVSAVVPDPTGFGRIIRSAGGGLERIVEQADATPEQAAVREVYTSIAVFERDALFRALRQIAPDNAQGEYYLPDVYPILAREGRVELFVAPDFRTVASPNDRKQLAEAERLLREMVLERWMEAGVTVVDPATTYVHPEVTLAPDVTIYPMTTLEGSTTIGSGSIIGPGAHVVDSQVGEGVRIRHSVVEESRIAAGARIGPYAHLRKGCDIGPQAEIGNFAEVKNSRVGAGSKMHHHGYVGDADIGARVNIGAGVIFVNYDGVEKHRSTVEDEAFIGCNVNVLAPRTIGKGAYIASGSTLHRDVPPDALAIARARQENKEGYASKLLDRARARRNLTNASAGTSNGQAEEKS